MDNQLRDLKNSMKNTVLKEVTFEKKQMDIVRKRMQEENNLPIFQLLKSEKSGFELLQSLRSRGVKTYDLEEGALYTKLHELEQKQWLTSRWIDEEKRYVLSQKGLKQLAELEEKAPKKKWSLQELFGGGKL